MTTSPPSDPIAEVIPATLGPNLGNLSPSKLKKIRLCEARAIAPLVDDDWTDDEKSEGTLAGTLAHNAAKHWYRPNPKWTEAVRAITDPAEKARAMQTREFNGIPKHAIATTAEAFLLSLAEVAGDKELPREAASVMEAQLLFEAIVNFYRRDLLNILFVERRYKGKLSNGVPVHLIIDMAIDKGNGLLDIVDFKTGFIKIDDEEMWSDDQVLLNLLAVSRDKALDRFTTKSFQFFWVRDAHASTPASLTADQLSTYEYWLMLEYQRMHDLKPAEAKEQVNRFCPSCSRRFKCNKYREMISEALGTFAAPNEVDLNAMDNNMVMEHVERIKLQTKQMEEFDSRLKAVMEYRLTQAGAGVKEIAGQRLKFRRRTMRRDVPDTATVIVLAQQFGKPLHELVSPRTKNVEAAFQGNPHAQSQLVATMRKGMSVPWIEVCPITEPKKNKKTEAGL